MQRHWLCYLPWCQQKVGGVNSDDLSLFLVMQTLLFMFIQYSFRHPALTLAHFAISNPVSRHIYLAPPPPPGKRIQLFLCCFKLLWVEHSVILITVFVLMGWARPDSNLYFECGHCGLVFMDPQGFPSAEVRRDILQAKRYCLYIAGGFKLFLCFVFSSKHHTIYLESCLVYWIVVRQRVDTVSHVFSFGSDERVKKMASVLDLLLTQLPSTDVCGGVWIIHHIYRYRRYFWFNLFTYLGTGRTGIWMWPMYVLRYYMLNIIWYTLCVWLDECSLILSF